MECRKGDAKTAPRGQGPGVSRIDMSYIVYS